MEFVETALFTSRIGRLGLEDAIRDLQLTINANPTVGAVDAGTGGLRKVRMADPGRGKGKRGGARVHYLLVPQRQRVYLVIVYSKDEDDVLSPAQKRRLRPLVEALKQEASRTE
jgi:mRNA-degrading endonuclease RelE of RelBE toxin-antitoxin system